MLNEIILGDCLEVMEQIPDKSVDMVLCDLPYGTTQCKWDMVIPFAPLWEQYNRICKGAIVLFAAQPFTSILISSNIANFKYDWCWKKPKGTGHLNAKKQPMRNKEDVCVFYSEQPTYNPQFSSGAPYKAKPGKSKVNHGGEDCYGGYKDIREDNEGKRYPQQIIEFGIVERDKLHATQKPVALFEYLIRTYTNEGDTVLDNCIGSGTTAIACINTNRNYIGIEKEEKYWKIAEERAKAHRLTNAWRLTGKPVHANCLTATSPC